MTARRRVVVTGIGAVTPLATGVKPSWERLVKGESGIGPITRFDASEFRTKIAAEVKNFAPEDFMEKKRARRTDPYIHYALAATSMAMEDSGLVVNEHNCDRVGVVYGTCIGGMTTYERNLAAFQEGGADKVSPFFITGFIPNMALAEIAIAYGIQGPAQCVITACATGANAIGDSFRHIQYGQADAMIAGGSEAYILPLGVAGLGRMGALSCARNDEPTKACRPFDKDRDGFVLGEGAGTLILEELEHALKRGAHIYGEVLGYATNVDGFHITEADSGNQARCISLALADGGIEPGQVDYINAHGTSTPSNDASETKALKLAFGDHAYKLAISSNKSMMGHLLAGAGTVEAIFTLLTMENSLVPPTINLDNPDPECDLDYVPKVARPMNVDIGVSESFGFGGSNAVVVMGKYKG